jgi:hypothetical protein
MRVKCTTWVSSLCICELYPELLFTGHYTAVSGAAIRSAISSAIDRQIELSSSLMSLACPFHSVSCSPSLKFHQLCNTVITNHYTTFVSWVAVVAFPGGNGKPWWWSVICLVGKFCYFVNFWGKNLEKKRLFVFVEWEMFCEKFITFWDI